jgi:sulfur carrier protein
MQFVLPKGKVMETPIVLPFFPPAGPFLKCKFLYMMEVIVNQKSVEIPEHCSIEEMLLLLPQLPAKGIAVALNHNIVARSEWSAHVLRSGDQVMIIKATQGG